MFWVDFIDKKSIRSSNQLTDGISADVEEAIGNEDKWVDDKVTMMKITFKTAL